MTPEEIPLLVAWIEAPHVFEWWREPVGIEDVTKEYADALAGLAETHVYVIEVDGVAVGMVQNYPHSDDPEWDDDVGIPRAAGIDYLIGDVHWLRRGIGNRGDSTCHTRRIAAPRRRRGGRRAAA
jgi:hypothetical protein